jgi:hypothetical protein
MTDGDSGETPKQVPPTANTHTPKPDPYGGTTARIADTVQVTTDDGRKIVGNLITPNASTEVPPVANAHTPTPPSKN